MARMSSKYGLSSPRPLLDYLLPGSRHQPHAVVAGGLVRRAADVGVVGGGADGVGDNEEVGETVGRITPVTRARRHLQRIGLTDSRHPSDEHVAASADNTRDAEG